MNFWIIIIVLLLFFIFNVLTGFYLSKFIKRFFISIPLWIQDLIRLDRSVFRGYGFWAFCGLGGSGKTISMVNYLINMRKLYPKVKILTNFHCSVADGRINSWRDLLETENTEIEDITEKEYYKFKRWGRDVWAEVDSDNMLYFRYKKNNGVIFGFDEIHLTFESTKWEDAPDNLLDFISQTRKFHKQIISSAQVFTRINKKLREQTNFVIECKSLFMGRLVLNKYYNTTEYIANDEKFDKGSKKRKTVKKDVFVAYDYIRIQYDTGEIMKELNVGKSPTSKLSDLINKYKKE